MKTRTRLILLAVLFAVGLLLGFIPQYLKKGEVEVELTRVQMELESSRRTVEAHRLQIWIAEVRDLAAMMYVEATRQNYGLAADFSTAYFTLLQETVSQSPNPEQKRGLEQLLSRRNAITSILAKGDAAAVAELRDLLLATHTVTRKERPQGASTR